MCSNNVFSCSSVIAFRLLNCGCCLSNRSRSILQAQKANLFSINFSIKTFFRMRNDFLALLFSLMLYIKLRKMINDRNHNIYYTTTQNFELNLSAIGDSDWNETKECFKWRNFLVFVFFLLSIKSNLKFELEINHKYYYCVPITIGVSLWCKRSPPCSTSNEINLHIDELRNALENCNWKTNHLRGTERESSIVKSLAVKILIRF